VAHGGLYALGAYISAWAVGGAAGAALGGNLGLVGLLLLLPAGAIVVAALGALIEPTLLRPLYKRPEEYHLLLTFGLLMILEDVMKFLFGGTPLSAGTIMDRMGSIPVGPLLYPTYNLVVIGVGLGAALGLWWFIYRTRFGVILRATSQDRRMAAALGLDVSRVYVQAFAIGCFMAGLGGAVVVPSQAAVLGMGVEALVLAFVVVVIGGLGSLEGALVGALVVSLVRTAGIQFFPEIELAVLYLIAAAVLLVRPTGLFGRA
jgi:branched-chain amino acid transport system permease protein